MKKLLATALALTVSAGALFGLSSCGGGGDNNIVVWCEATGADKAVMDEFVKYFNENNDLGYTKICCTICPTR